ncbi:MAG TPA: metal ABC transporter permease [Dehalococcoidia bacterium]|nr:metal ABC transporter permease [Dehalococcoidia bacterium]
MPLIADFFGYLGEPWQAEFMRRALVAALLASTVSGVIGSFVVLKGMSFIGDALPHASFGGIAIAFVLGVNLQLGGAFAVLLWALAIGFVTRRGFIRHDTAIGLSLMAGFALGVLIISRQSNYTVDLFGFVFGNVLAVSWRDVWVAAGLGALVILMVGLFYKELLFTAYDPSMAAATGIPVTLLHYGLLALIGLTVVIGLQVMGIVLVLAMLVAPAATAQLLARSLPGIMAGAAAIGGLATVCGLYAAWYADVSVSSAIVLSAVGLFVLAFLFSPHKGLFRQFILSNKRMTLA